MEHEDKLRYFQPSPKADVPPAIITGKTRQEDEAEKLALMERKQAEAFEGNKKLLNEKYAAFLADTSSAEKLEKHGIEWGAPGFIVEVFVAEYPSKVLVGDDISRKFTPYAKILSASPFNEGPKKNWKAGDITHIGDSYMSVQVNPIWEAWHEGQKSNARLMGKEPTQYIRKIYGWIIGGKLYAMDKAKYILTKELTILSEANIKTFQGPWTFLIDDYDIGTLKVSGNPWE